MYLCFIPHLTEQVFFDSGKRRLANPKGRIQKALINFSLFIFRSIVNRVKIAYHPEITKK
jgi:hypothetical protein